MCVAGWIPSIRLWHLWPVSKQRKGGWPNIDLYSSSQQEQPNQNQHTAASQRQRRGKQSTARADLCDVSACRGDTSEAQSVPCTSAPHTHTHGHCFLLEAQWHTLRHAASVSPGTAHDCRLERKGRRMDPHHAFKPSVQLAGPHTKVPSVVHLECANTIKQGEHNGGPISSQGAHSS